MHEPGPWDQPGPCYESFDSGPSFGNFGPLPDNGSHNGEPLWWKSWEQRNYGTPLTGARVPLPTSVASPLTAALAINVEPPSSASGSKSQHKVAASQVSGTPLKLQKSAISGIESKLRETITARTNRDPEMRDGLDTKVEVVRGITLRSKVAGEEVASISTPTFNIDDCLFSHCAGLFGNH
ncbi:hypothetical protein EDD15DRAFT_2464483 [Pisolithus albus]|nr:hypothetical protein EDD15DRAFT_2464483 [Pisolithus albus]